MIEHIFGVVKSIEKGSLILSVGPLALSLQVPTRIDLIPDQEATMYVQLHWNQENGPSLYGFSTQLEKKVFMLITSCSGMGPKVALAVLSDLGVESFVEAIQTGDDKALSTVSGIGPKKAEQIAVQLKHKVAKLIASGVEIQGSSVVKWHEVRQVLESLNYSRSEISAAMHYLSSSSADKKASLDELIRHALSFLSKNK